MNTKTKNIIGNVLNYLISALVIITGIFKLIKFKPEADTIMKLSPHYYEHIYLLGIVSIAAGILFLIKRTFIYGFIAILVFFGGTISAHMQIGEHFILQIVFVCLTAITACLKRPEWFKPKKTEDQNI